MTWFAVRAVGYAWWLSELSESPCLRPKTSTHTQLAGGYFYTFAYFAQFWTLSPVKLPMLRFFHMMTFVWEQYSIIQHVLDYFQKRTTVIAAIAASTAADTTRRRLEQP